jgi:PAS domain S-box-containing protein
MSAIQYPFIDIAVHERVRDRFAAGEAVVLFSPDMRNALWANGRGAELFGHASVYDFIDQGPNRSDVAFRQTEAAGHQLSAVGDKRSFVIRATSGFQRIAIQASCELVQVGGGTAVLFAAAAENGKLSVEACAKRMIEGLDDPDTHMAVLSDDGSVIAASPQFSSLGISEQTAKMLVNAAGNDPSRLSKRPIPSAKGYLPAAIGKLSEDPALHLLLTVEAAPGRDAAHSAGLEPAQAAASASVAGEAFAETDNSEHGLAIPELADVEGFDAAIDAVAGIEEPAEPEEEISLDPAAPAETAAPDQQPAAESAALDEAQSAETRATDGSADAPSSAEAELEGEGFVFKRDARATRFVWKIDAEGKFREVSGEFADTVGPHAANLNGMAFSDLAALFRLDPDGKIVELLGKRDTWSGKTIWWPVEGTSLVVPVDLAALPTYTRAREFDGFRGFGIVRVGDAKEDPEAVGLTLTTLSARPQAQEASTTEETAPATADESVETLALEDGDVLAAALPDDVPQTTLGPEMSGKEVGAADNAEPVEEPSRDEAEEEDRPSSPSLLDWPAGELPALRIVEATSHDPSDKVVQFDERRLRRDLTPGEQAAFREIARQLDSFVVRSTAESLAATSEHVGNEARVPNQGRRDEIDDRQEQPLSGESAADETATPEPASEAVTEEPSDEAIIDERADEAVSSNSLEPATEEPSVDRNEEEIRAEEPEPAPTGESAEPSKQELLGQLVPIRERIGLSPDIVDQMPVALLVHSGDRLIHGNPEFLRLTGYASIEALAEVGGLDALLQRQELEDKTAEAGGMIVVRADDVVVPVTARLQSILWDQASALMLALMPVAAESKPDTEATGEEGDTAQLHGTRPADQLAQLQVEVEELRAILETATDGVVIIGADGSIRSMNRAASALFNYDNEEATGRPFVMLFAHESQRAIVDYLGGLSGHGVASVLNDGREVIGREASGGFLPLFMTIGRLTSSNGFCAVIRDITQWKRTEEELRTAKRAAETANAHKSEFLAHVSHEIRTPLNAIIGFADMMATERFGPIGHPRYVEYANDIGRSGRHVLDIVNDLLDISKIEAGEMELDFSAIGLNETISEAVSLVQPQANSQRVIIRTALSHAVPPVVADLRSIKQIVLNILSNAIRFTPSGGQIVVSTAYEANGSVALRIRDTGVGMTRPELELAMKPFRQVAGGTRKRGDGTGLGLPLTKAMVDANRASFSITSAPNEGTLVEITFPSPRVLAN